MLNGVKLCKASVCGIVAWYVLTCDGSLVEPNHHLLYANHVCAKLKRQAGLIQGLSMLAGPAITHDWGSIGGVTFHLVPLLGTYTCALCAWWEWATGLHKPL